MQGIGFVVQILICEEVGFSTGDYQGEKEGTPNEAGEGRDGSVPWAIASAGDVLAMGQAGLPEDWPETDAWNGLVGQWGGVMYAAAVQGDYAYVGVGARLAVLDIRIQQHRC